MLTCETLFDSGPFWLSGCVDLRSRYGPFAAVWGSMWFGLKKADSTALHYRTLTNRVPSVSPAASNSLIATMVKTLSIATLKVCQAENIENPWKQLFFLRISMR